MGSAAPTDASGGSVTVSENGRPISGSATAGKTWAPSDAPQRWGPWRVIGGAGKQLTFLNVYLCGQSAPSVVQLGVYPGT